ncbi:MAG TPA: 50S ribosomal protein L11 methyltransferase [Gammaproteobacteria bacterium]|nr:50S ribosomal protein L11 methyltransferase [Gammaproteobacteria bacterium]
MRTATPLVQLTLEIDADQCERLEALVEEAGAISVSYLDPGGEPVLEPALGTTPLWSRVRLLALFQGWPDAERLYLDVCEALSVERPAHWELAPLEQRQWERAWMDHYRPMHFGGRLWVVPTTYAAPEPDAINLRLDPGLAFGTGTHPTTALCLRWLAQADLAGGTVVDFGCGSGILAIASLLLGAQQAYGIDNDPQALVASQDNAQRNGVADRLTLWLPGEVQPVTADVLVANILAGVLIELRPAILPLLRPGGRIALSGILERQQGDVEAAYAEWIEWEPAQHDDGWVLLTGRRRG